MLQPAGRQLEQSMRKPLRGLVRVLGEDDLIESLRLRLYGRYDAGMSVPVCNDPPG